MDYRFSDWLIYQMNKKGISQAELASKSGLSRTAISNLVSEKRRPGPDACQYIAKALSIPPETVYRAAGLLPPIKPRDAKREILLHLADQLSDEDYTEVVRYTELRLAIAEEKGKYAARSVPQKAS